MSTTRKLHHLIALAVASLLVVVLATMILLSQISIVRLAEDDFKGIPFRGSTPIGYSWVG